MYNVFISYRKSSSINADLIRKSIADNSAFGKSVADVEDLRGYYYWSKAGKNA